MTTAVMNGIDLTDLDNFADGFPHHLFEQHRREAPVYWHEPTAHTPDGEGFWSVATYAETAIVQLDAATYSSERGGDRKHGGTLLQDLEVAGLVLSMMDDPRHARIRRLVSAGLTPRTVGRLEDELRRRTIALLDAIEDDVPFDFVMEVASELPMQAICILLGVPEDDRHELGAFFDAGFDIREGDAGFADTGPTANADAAAGNMAMLDYCVALVAAKRSAPTDDMLSVVVHATLPEVEPAQLTDVELYSFFSLLFAAGAQTTRHAITGGLLALLERPDQLADLRADLGLLVTTIEEVLRWTTPSPAKRRTVARPASLGGHALTPGEKVFFWEASANRDDLVFDDPMAFDIRRDPNPHLALGRGVHYCLGANLARLEMRVVFEEVLRRFPTIEQAGDVEWTRSNRHSGIRHLPVRMRR
jgi:cytochrome P450